MLALGWLIGGVLSTLIGNEATLVMAGLAMASLNVWVYLTTHRSSKQVGFAQASR